jgi:hypothetical protein
VHPELDGVSEGIAVGVLAHEARVDDVRGLGGESCDAARRADWCSLDVSVVALIHGPSSSQEKGSHYPSAQRAHAPDNAGYRLV